MVSDNPTDGRCNYEYTPDDGYDPDTGHCEGHPMDNGLCFHHGGKRTGGAPEGNDNAEGGGAPEGNDNAATHELYAAENTYYQRRSETAQQFIIETYQGYHDKWCRLKPESPTTGDEAMLFRCAVDIHKVVFKADEWETAKPDQLESGHVMVDRSEKRSPQGKTYFEYVETAVHRAQHRLQQRTRMWLKDNDLIDSPESQQAAATMTLAEVVNGE